MKNHLISITTTILLTTAGFITATPDLPRAIKDTKATIAFTENKGQVTDQHGKQRPDVLYGVTAGDMAVHIKRTGVSYQLYRVDRVKESIDPKPKQKHMEVEAQTVYRIDLSWLNHNPDFTRREDQALPGYCNYYTENCPNGALYVKSYKGITLANLYNGIDLHYYEKNEELKHDYIVAPGSDYKQIQLRVEGADIKVNDDGSLQLITPLGTVQEGAPVVYQNGRLLLSKWVFNNDVLSFDISNCNPAYELIIDPVTRLWGTYYGGLLNDSPLNVCTDKSGNSFLTGYTNTGTSTLIATSGAHQSAYGGNSDAFAAKFDPSGTRLWATYYGGTAADYGLAGATDFLGNVYLAGYAGSSPSVITTPGSHQPTFAGPTSDAFLAKFDANGVRLWATYYGGNSDEIGYGCATDKTGNVYLTGITSTNTGTVIATPGSHQPVFAYGFYDAFLVKFNSTGVRQWGTYYGGSDYDYASGCATDTLGNVFLTGTTNSIGGSTIATPGSYQAAFGGTSTGVFDAYLVKFNSAGVRQWGTYYGGNGDEGGSACVTDLAGNVYMCGTTNGNTPMMGTAGSHQPTFGGGNNDAYLVKFNSTGTRLWGTFYGGAGGDAGYSCATDKFGNVYMAGVTVSGNAIATLGTHQPGFAGTSDGFLARFTGSGGRLWGTYYGGTADDGIAWCATDTLEHVYITGGTKTYTGTGIATPNSHQPAGSANYDGFLVKFVVCNTPPAQPATINGPSVVCAGSIAAFSTPTVLGVNSHTWSLPGGWTGTASVNMLSLTALSSGVFTLVSGNGCGISPQQTLYLTVNPQPTVVVSNTAICKGKTFTIVPGGAAGYTFSSGPFVTPNVTTSYSVYGISSLGCIGNNPGVITITVQPLPTLSISTTHTMLCAGEEATLTATGALSFTFNAGGAGPDIFVSPKANTTYTITGVDVNGCSNTAVFTQSVDACNGLVNSAQEVSGIKLFPNPTSGMVYVQVDSEKEMTIVNAVGQIVYAIRLGKGTHPLNLEHLARGIYFLRAPGAPGSGGTRIVIE
jgi:hypothetical protein